MRLFFINRFFYPDHSATSQMLSDLAFGLADQGHQVTVITSRLRYDVGEEKLPARETIGGVEVVRVWTSRFGRSQLALRSVDYLTFNLAAAWALMQQVRKGDTVIAKTDPPMISVLAMPIARMRDARLVNWLQDIYPDVAEALDVGGSVVGVGYNILRLLRNASLRAADINVVIGDRMRNRLLALDIDDSRVCTIPNWADCDTIKPVERSANSLRLEWGMGEAFIVGYSGNLGRAHEIETFLAAITDVEFTCSRTSSLFAIRWLFIGGGALYEAMKRETRKRGLKSVDFKPYQPRKLLSESLSVADVHLVSLRQELEGLIVPSKFYGVAAAGRPVIFVGGRDGEIARLVARFDCGLTIEQGDGMALAKAVIDLARCERRCREMGQRARAAAETHFSKTAAIERWETLLQAKPQQGSTG